MTERGPLLEELSRNLHEAYEPGALLLLGSFGTDDEWERSDIDLALVFEQPPEGRLGQYLRYADRDVALSFASFSGLERLSALKVGPGAYERGTALHAFSGARLMNSAGSPDGRARMERILSQLRDCVARLAPAMSLMETAQSLRSIGTAEKAIQLHSPAEARLASLQAISSAARALSWMNGRAPGRFPARDLGLSLAAPGMDDAGVKGTCAAARKILEAPLAVAESRFREVLLSAVAKPGHPGVFDSFDVVELFPEMDHSPLWDSLFDEMKKRSVLVSLTLPCGSNSLRRRGYRFSTP